ncbi:MAG: ABC transporter permease [Lentisphaerae bacterium]|jgi:peptide/nickel transport system permease protein|nr:ABC transporter permease [Lentisphaerota bacterium]
MWSRTVDFIKSLPLNARISIVVILIYSLAALWAEITAFGYKLRDETPAYNAVNVEQCYQPPLSRVAMPDGSTRIALMGTDNLGRDVFSRLLQGARLAFHVGIVTSLIAVPFGALLGLLAGYFGGRVDSICTWLAATVAAIPALLLILAVSLVVGKGLLGVYVGISVTTWVGIYRTVRAETLKHRGLGYVQAARTLGYGKVRIILRHILPNVLHVIIIAFSTRFPAAVGTEVFMGFLGIGVQNEPSWGVMINNARVRLWQGVWWEGTFVTLALFALVLSFNQLGDALRDRLDPSRAG